jgi:hypothetical protein
MADPYVQLRDHPAPAACKAPGRDPPRLLTMQGETVEGKKRRVLGQAVAVACNVLWKKVRSRKTNKQTNFLCHIGVVLFMLYLITSMTPPTVTQPSTPMYDRACKHAAFHATMGNSSGTNYRDPATSRRGPCLGEDPVRYNGAGARCGAQTVSGRCSWGRGNRMARTGSELAALPRCWCLGSRARFLFRFPAWSEAGALASGLAPRPRAQTSKPAGQERGKRQRVNLQAETGNA